MFKQARIFIYGDVIGVGFRAWTKYQSTFINVKGWVRNFKNNVEVLLQGEEKDIKNMIIRIKNGPPTSIVSSAEVIWETSKEIFYTFEIKK